MNTFTFPSKNKQIILALGAESAGNFSAYRPLPCNQGKALDPLPLYSGGDVRYSGQRGFRTPSGTIHFSENFGDLLEEKNWTVFQKAVLAFLKKEKLQPNVILTDLHPLMKTTLWGEELAKKFQATHLQVQHHHAHIFSSVGDYLCPLPCNQGRAGEGFRTLPATFYAIAMDGTGYGTDEKIWGGEIFKVTSNPLPLYPGGDVRYSGQRGFRRKFSIGRIGHLENQTLLGGEIAIREPARVLIGILSKFLEKKKIYPFVKKYYTKNEFELLYNQLQNNFNCTETSSTGRVLDAASVLLGFSGNERKEKHGPTYLLEKNSTLPYKIPLPLYSGGDVRYSGQRGFRTLNTTYLFKYLIKNLHKDKKRLAATVQNYLARGLYEIIEKDSAVPLPCNQGRCPVLGVEGLSKDCKIFLSGGLAKNKIIAAYFKSQDAHLPTQIPPGDAGLSFGQIVYYLLSE